jgi:hypothetical protein
VTGGQFSGVDIDLLADYVGGALDGTPDETVVAGLVADDPAWRAAYEVLTGGMAAIGADLRLLGAADEPMPAELSARLDTAFAALPPLTGPVADDHVEGAADEAESVTTGARQHLHAVPDEVGTGPGRPHRERSTRPGARRTLHRWGAPIAVAAGVLAFAGIGLGDLFSGGAGSQDAGTSTTAGEQNAPMMDSGAEPAVGAESAAVAQSITASGTDYRRGTLSRQAQARALSTEGSTFKASPSDEQENALTRGVEAPPALRRLNVRDALLACLDAIAAEHRSGTIAAESVDYAAFEGRPAVVVRFGADDGRWTWVSGPDCGTPGSGADTRYQVRVG